MLKSFVRNGLLLMLVELIFRFNFNALGRWTASLNRPFAHIY